MDALLFSFTNATFEAALYRQSDQSCTAEFERHEDYLKKSPSRQTS